MKMLTLPLFQEDFTCQSLALLQKPSLHWTPKKTLGVSRHLRGAPKSGSLPCEPDAGLERPVHQWYSERIWNVEISTKLWTKSWNMSWLFSPKRIWLLPNEFHQAHQRMESAWTHSLSWHLGFQEAPISDIPRSTTLSTWLRMACQVISGVQVPMLSMFYRLKDADSNG